MTGKFNKLPDEKMAHQRPTMTPFAKKVWLAASTAMYNHFKELGVEQYAVCYLQMPKPTNVPAFNSLNWEDEEE